jgi:hypothetical protein
MAAADKPTATSNELHYAETPLEDGALDGVSGGRLSQGDTAHPLSWSDVLTDPNVAVPFDPAAGDATARTLHDLRDKTVDDTKPAATITYANW